MKEILQTIIENLVDEKESISISEIERESGFFYEVRVSENDMGKIIGRQGKIAQSIRNVMKAIASKEHKRITIEFIG